MPTYKYGELCHFNGPSEFYEGIASKPIISKPKTSQDKGLSGWHGTSSWEEAQRLAVAGWPEGVSAAKPLMHRISTRLVESLKRPEIVYDVTGDMFDMGKVVEEVPECWMKWEDGQEASITSPVHIVSNVSASCGISPETIIRKGSAVMALVMVLEASGRRCKVDVCCSLDSGYGRSTSSWGEMSLTVKDYYDDLNLDALAYPLMQPSFLRRHVFRFAEVSFEDLDSGYGMPADPKWANRGDIFLSRALNSDPQWESDKAAMTWVLGELRKQKVDFKD